MSSQETRVDAEITLKVREAQVQQLFKQTWGALAGVIATALLVCLALWRVLPAWKLTWWVGLLLLVTVSRGVLNFAFSRNNPSGPDIFKWARWHEVGTFIAGLIWASASLFLWPSHSPMHQMIWPICIVALAASSVAKYFTWTRTYLPFLFLAVVPISLRLLAEGGLTLSVLGLLGLIFTAVLAQTGRLMHTSSSRAFELGIRNEALSSYLAKKIAKEAELAQELQIAHDQLRQISMTDELTKLWNRRFLNATISEDVEQVIRKYFNIHQGREVSLLSNIDIAFIMVDIDHFKAVNDCHGHGAGDQVLMQMGELLTAASRDTDTVIRWGGEEFLVVARSSDREQCGVLAERIRQAVDAHPFDIGRDKPLHLTCSLGVATYPFLPKRPDVLTWDRVVELADACLYAAKRSGRNAWLGVVSTGLANVEDLDQHLASHLPTLILAGKLEMKTNLPKGAIVWGDVGGL